MYISKKSLSRRTFLQNTGVTITLPFLDSMVPAFASNVDIPNRLNYLYLPTGRIPDSWYASVDGLLCPTLKPLADHRENISVLQGLDVGNGKGAHSGPCAAFLTGVAPGKEKEVQISVDQIIAKQIGVNTKFSSMELGVDPPEWAFAAVDGLAGYYTSTLSWATGTTPLPVEINPRKVFERMFGEADNLNSEEMKKRIELKKSILDNLNQSVGRLMKTVAQVDKHKLDEYFNSIREIERSIAIEEQNPLQLDEYTEQYMIRPTGIPRVFADHVKLMFDMMVLAYQTNMTNVITFMFGGEGTNRNYLELGASDGHHSLTHHKGDEVSINLVRAIEYHQSELINYYINRLKSIIEVDGSRLFDKMLIVSGSAHGDSNMHLHKNVPMMIMSGSNKLGVGKDIIYENDKYTVSDLHLATMKFLNVDPTEYMTERTDAKIVLPEILKTV
jgi:hypothetical protein